MTYNEFVDKLDIKDNGNLTYSEVTFGALNRITIAETVTGSYGVHSDEGSEFFRDEDDAIEWAYEVVLQWNL